MNMCLEASLYNFQIPQILNLNKSWKKLDDTIGEDLIPFYFLLIYHLLKHYSGVF